MSWALARPQGMPLLTGVPEGRGAHSASHLRVDFSPETRGPKYPPSSLNLLLWLFLVLEYLSWIISSWFCYFKGIFLCVIIWVCVCVCIVCGAYLWVKHHHYGDHCNMDAFSSQGIFVCSAHHCAIMFSWYLYLYFFLYLSHQIWSFAS